MATIANLAVSVLELSIDDCIDFIKELRRKRRIPKVKKVTKKVSGKKPTTMSIDTLVSKLSESDVDALIKTLEEES